MIELVIAFMAGALVGAGIVALSVLATPERTGGVDVQKDRLELTVVDWGEGEEAWMRDHVILPGDTAQPDVWNDLADTLDEFAPEALAVDSGYNASHVYAFVEQAALLRAQMKRRPWTEAELPTWRR